MRHTNDHAYGFAFEPLSGNKNIDITDYRGRVVMIVNTASKCGFTPQYAELETLYQRYQDQGLTLIGIPSNDFFWQERGTHQQIADFCRIHYGVSFPMAAKTHVTGMNAHPFYRWAKRQVGVFGSPKWNFHKYLLNRDGQLVDFFHFFTRPLSPKVIRSVERQLARPAEHPPIG
jgi:glutathione peroxidase